VGKTCPESLSRRQGSWLDEDPFSAAGGVSACDNPQRQVSVPDLGQVRSADPSGVVDAGIRPTAGGTSNGKCQEVFWDVKSTAKPLCERRKSARRISSAVEVEESGGVENTPSNRSDTTGGISDADTSSVVATSVDSDDILCRERLSVAPGIGSQTARARHFASGLNLARHTARSRNRTSRARLRVQSPAEVELSSSQVTSTPRRGSESHVCAQTDGPIMFPRANGSETARYRDGEHRNSNFSAKPGSAMGTPVHGHAAGGVAADPAGPAGPGGPAGGAGRPGLVAAGVGPGGAHYVPPEFDSSQTYEVGEVVLYFSATHNQWMKSAVTAVKRDRTGEKIVLYT